MSGGGNEHAHGSWFHPEPRARHRAHRADPAPCLRADARARRGGRDLHLGEAGRRAWPPSGHHRRDRDGGDHRRCHRCSRVPPLHRLRLERRRHLGHDRDLARRAEYLGRRRRRRTRRHLHGAPQAPRHLGAVRRDRAGRRRSAGDRPLGELVQPGTVRATDHLAVGPRDRRRAPTRGIRALRHVPTDVPVRVALVPADLRRDHLPGASRASTRQGPGVHAVHRDVHVRAVLHGAPAYRQGHPVFGIRFNALLSAALCIASTIVFVRLSQREPTPALASTAVESAPGDSASGESASGESASGAAPALSVADGSATAEVTDATDADGAPPTSAS